MVLLLRNIMKYPNSVPGFRAFNLDLVPLTKTWVFAGFFRCHPFFGQLSPLENSDIGKSSTDNSVVGLPEGSKGYRMGLSTPLFDGLSCRDVVVVFLPGIPGTHPLSSSPISRIADHLPQIVGTDASENWGHLSNAANSMVPGYLKDRGQWDVNG